MASLSSTTIIKDLLNNIESGIVSAILIFMMFSTWLFKDRLAIWLDMTLGIKTAKIKGKIAELENHDVFITCDRAKQDVKMIDFYTDGCYDLKKKNLCSSFTAYKTDTCKERISKLTQMELYKKPKQSLKKFLLEEQSDIHREYIELIRADWKNRGMNNEEIDLIINMFESTRIDAIKMFESRIDSIFGNSYYSNNFHRLLAVFEMWAGGIELLPRDMKITFEYVGKL